MLTSSFESARAWGVALVAFGLFLCPLPSALSAEYQLVSGKQFRLCTELVKNFNEFKDEPPMVCERKFSPKYKDFRRPNWIALDPAKNWTLIESIRRSKESLVGGMTPERMDKTMAEYRVHADERLTQGKLRLFEAHFDLARRGQKARVIMLDDYCDPNTLTPVIGGPTLSVLNDDESSPDPRFRQLGREDDVFFYEGLPYLATRDSFPSAIGRSPGPQKNHDGYILIREPFWLQWPEEVYKEGVAGTKTPICQIGYKHQ